MDAIESTITRLETWSPLYRHELSREPAWRRWLQQPGNLDKAFRYSAFRQAWDEMFASEAQGEAFWPQLRAFRRLMSIRLACRCARGLETIEPVLIETSLLADFCLQQAWQWTRHRWEQRLGSPKGGSGDGAMIPFCVLGLGKLGGRELNFCSDVDLILFFGEEGPVFKNGTQGSLTAREFFSRAAGDYVARLQEREGDRLVYHVDLRLRPEGDSGPLVRTAAGMEQYYAGAGQGWERLAWLRCRPVAGDRSLGAELLEDIQTFRYPRYPPASLVAEIAALKRRTELESPSRGDRHRNIKLGPGGIREIEFVVQALQLLHGGKQPFLQVESTLDALSQLGRYGYLAPAQVDQRQADYRFLRMVENAVQIREERQTHELPGKEADRAALARFLRVEPEEFEEQLAAVRDRVHQGFEAFFAEHAGSRETGDWMAFFTGRPPRGKVADNLARWFPEGSDERRAEVLRRFVLGRSSFHVSRAQVQLFEDVSAAFDQVLPPLAEPLETIERVGSFAEAYGAASQFIKTCALNPALFGALARLFDRSRFAHELVCRHPEIIEELLQMAMRRRKSLHDHRQELKQLPPGDAFPRLSWLYLKSEQVRLAISELLGDFDLVDVERGLSDLADAFIQDAIERLPGAEGLAIIALGKCGARELSPGSDLDLVILAPDEGELSEYTQVARSLHRALSHSEGLGKAYEVDLRLRPHGQDGPLVTRLSAWEAYLGDGGAGQPWELFLLCRARPAAGHAALAEGYEAMRTRLLIGPQALSREAIGASLLSMRARAQSEKLPAREPWSVLKTAPGGLVDIEILAQWLWMKQARNGGPPGLHSTREALHAAHHAGLLDGASLQALLDAYNFQRRIEFYVRRDRNDASSSLPSSAQDRYRLARWLGFPDFDGLRKRLVSHQSEAAATFEATWS